MTNSLANAPELLADTSADAQDTSLVPIREEPKLTISGETVTQKTAHLPEDQRAVIRWAYDYAKAQNWSLAEAAKQFGTSTTTLYRVWNDQYKDATTGERVNCAKLCATLVKGKNLLLERGAATRIPFAETSIWKKINKICEEALITQTIALIYGDAHIGKTTCLLEHQRRNNHGQTKYLRTPSSASLNLFIHAIARACNVSDKGTNELTRAAILKALDPTMLLIVDEIHQTSITFTRANMLRTLEFLRELHDVTHCGVVLCGTNTFRDEFVSGEYAHFLKQLRRRGIIEFQLPAAPPRADLDLIAASYHLPPLRAEAEKLVLAIAREHGLGRFCNYLAMGARHAAKNHERYTWNNFHQAYDIFAKLSATAKTDAQPSTLN